MGVEEYVSARFGCFAGKRMWNDVPTPASLSTQMRPLWSLITDCTIAKPSPVPCFFVV
jgi:hypothetical protein